MILICFLSLKEDLKALKCYAAVRVVVFGRDGRFSFKNKKQKIKSASNLFHSETSGDSKHVSHGETVIFLFFNYPKIIITNKASSDLHTGSSFFLFLYTSHLTPTRPFPCYLLILICSLPQFTHPRQINLSRQAPLSLRCMKLAYSLVYSVWRC